MCHWRGGRTKPRKGPLQGALGYRPYQLASPSSEKTSKTEAGPWARLADWTRAWTASAGVGSQNPGKPQELPRWQERRPRQPSLGRWETGN